MWGHHVHEAVLAAGCKVSGCTVHFCTNEYDKGPIIVQRTCPVDDDDTPDTLAARVFEQECIAYPEAIRLFAEGRLQVEDHRTKVKRI
jgi:folate-dependent phosphoribosylglycinamide formyltransferase PurN